MAATHRGLYDFAARDASMLSFKKGDLFSEVSSGNNGWATVKNEKGERGMVPDSYLEPVHTKVRLLRSLEECHSTAKERGGVGAMRLLTRGTA